MKTVLKHAHLYTGTEQISDGFIRFSKKIEELGPMSAYQPQSAEKVIDLAGQLIVPGFIDVHSHGGYGFDAMDGDAAQLDEMVRHMVHEGITSYFPTTMTQSHAKIAHAMNGIREAAAKNPVIQGIHLEGPFISPVFKGAQPEEYIQNPDAALLAHWDELSGHRVKLITYAPEDEHAAEFEDYCLAHGIVPSVGHSNALREQLKHSKASHVTHLYNAQREFKHRQPGVTGHALLEDNLYCEMIADGFHVVPDMIKLAYEIKGPYRMELVTDSMRAKGMPEGVSELGGQKVIVKDKQARLETGNLAGSVLQFQDAFRNIIRFTGCGIAEAVLMSSVNQAREFGLEHKGTLTVGKDADLNVFDQNLELKETYSLGQLASD
ncbi:N-acetylglucosamine-6-phosphate deacetylase [Liquorilactobacillus satsumensis]|uniref:N-acetylglucosamine-6-phosphate deacetylase n=1 Tax=Liquorilactobacillus satsumensis DSM 16230 = JCM 12392 TaxID=1423801 RepID=A0A0R1V448_9LACO|nr:N-acetylglucosamine-6-phosphate deacetylase [Liquorilactobacillus satsumensis]KRM00271.1 N-acetylglucosamine-6-phosphate deacetylase [Liquorilactobacillus satsumensis DSM 16230 = JCM 12392]MCP9328154.1 N-acetylglucosamine-6-phosphate deacetylase [Liquorilactobacillus satsumensis]